MTIYIEMQTELQELVDLVKLDEQYTAAVAHQAIQPDQGTDRVHQQRVVRIVELKRKYGLK